MLTVTKQINVLETRTVWTGASCFYEFLHYKDVNHTDFQNASINKSVLRFLPLSWKNILMFFPLSRTPVLKCISEHNKRV